MPTHGTGASDSAADGPDSTSPLAGEPVDERVAELLVWLVGSRTRARIYVHLRRSPGRTSGEIAEATGLYPSTVRASVASMHQEGLLTRSKRSLGGRGNNPYEYRAIPPADLVGEHVHRLESRLNAVYEIDRHLLGRETDDAREPVEITVGDAVDD